MQSLLVVAIIATAACVAAAQHPQPMCQPVNNDAPCDPTATIANAPFPNAGICNSYNRNLKLKPTRGSIPSKLQRTSFFVNIPAQFSFANGTQDVEHVFDGQAQLWRFDFGGESSDVHVTANFPNTSSYNKLCSTGGTFDENGAFTLPCPGLLFPKNKLNNQTTTTACVPKRGKEFLNFDVSLLELNGRFFQTTDAQSFVEFDPDTLQSLGPVGFDDALSKAGVMGLTHAGVTGFAGDKRYRSVALNARPSLAKQPSSAHLYEITETSPRLLKRRILANLSGTSPAYSHTMGSSTTHTVWVENPIDYDVFNIAVLGQPPIRSLRPSSRAPVAHVFDHALGNSTSFTLPKDFGWATHGANVFASQRGDSVVYQVSHTADLTVYNKLTTKNILSHNDGGLALEPALFSVCEFFLDGSGKHTCDTTSVPAGFPRMNENFKARPSRWVYTVREDRFPFSVLDKIDTMSPSGPAIVASFNATASAAAGGDAASITETLMLPYTIGSSTNNSDVEDDGLLLTIALHQKSQRSSLLALDAKTLDVVFELTLPWAVPFHLHGIVCQQRGEEWYCLSN